MKMLNAHHGMLFYEGSMKLRNICKTEYRAMEKEWITCPRCKNKRLIPNKMGTKPNGRVWIWWMCENNKVCQFPFDMPAQVYHSEQSAEQAASGYFPLPRILSLPQKFYHLYPITFASYFQEKRCSSSASVQRSTCDSGVSSSSGGVSSLTESAAQQNSASQPVPKESVGNEPSCSTSEGIVNVDDRGYEIDNEEMETNKRRRPIRTVKKEGFFDTDKSWSKLIAKIAQNNQDYSSFLNIDEEQLISRVKGIIDEVEATKQPVAFTQKSRRRTMQLDDHDTAMRQYPLVVRWGVARERLLRAKDTLKQEVRGASNVDEVLNAIGVETKPSTSNTASCSEVTRERAKVLSGKIEKVLKRMHQSDDVDERIKRQKLETEQRRQTLHEQRKNAVKSLAKSRVLSRLSNIERPTPSITPYSSVASSYYDGTPQPSPANYVANEYSLDLSGLHDDYQQPMQQHQPPTPAPVEVTLAQAQEQEPVQQYQQPSHHHDDLDLDQLLFDNLNDVNFTGNLDDDHHQQQHHNYDNYNDDNYDDLQF